MASGNSESDTETDLESPEGERLAAVGSDSLSEGSTNTPFNVSKNCYEQDRPVYHPGWRVSEIKGLTIAGNSAIMQ